MFKVKTIFLLLNSSVSWEAYRCLVTIIMGLAVSFAVKKQGNQGLEVVCYSGKKEVAILLACFVAIVLFSISLPNLLY